MGRVCNAGVEEFQVEMVHQNTSYVMAVSLQSCLVHDCEVGKWLVVPRFVLCACCKH